MARILMMLLCTAMLATDAVAEPMYPRYQWGRWHTEARNELLDCLNGKWPNPTIQACNTALAHPWIEMFLRQPGTRANIFFRRARAYNDKHEDDLALADFNEAIRLFYSDAPPRILAEALYQRSVLYLKKRDYDRCFGDLDEAVRVNPADASALILRGQLYASPKHDYDRAIADLDEAARLQPQQSLPFKSRGKVYALYKHDFDRAITDFDEALRHYPRDATALAYRGLGYMAKGESERARADLDAAERIDPGTKRAIEQQWLSINGPKTP